MTLFSFSSCNYLTSCEFNISNHTDPTAMKNQITQNINDAEALEMLYRQNKRNFALDFPEASAGVDNELVKFWQIRLKSDTDNRKHDLLKSDLWIVAILSFVIAVLAKAHIIAGNVTMEDYWVRNLPAIVFAGLTAWFILKNRITGVKNILLLILPVVILSLLLNLLPGKPGDTARLAFIHAPVFMWFIFGLAWVSLKYSQTSKV